MVKFNYLHSEISVHPVCLYDKKLTRKVSVRILNIPSNAYKEILFSKNNLKFLIIINKIKFYC